MKFAINILWLTLLLTLLAGCTKRHVRQLVGSAIANEANTEVKYTSLKCRALEQKCGQGDFQEWQTSNKDLGCSCKKL